MKLEGRELQRECGCGCREIIKSGNSFLFNYHRINKKHSEETKKKISEVNSGSKNPFYNKNYSEKQKEIWSILRKGKFVGKDNPFYGKKHKVHPRGFLGSHHTKETKEKMSKLKIGINNSFYDKKHSDKSKKQMSESLKGRTPWNKGISLSLRIR